MKKFLPVLLILCLCLTGCGEHIPVQAADGASWNDDWVTVGGIIGVDTPAGIDHREYNDTRGIRGMYYAAWSIGEGVPYVNADGNDATIYDAQFYLLLAGYDSAEKAEDALAEWRAMASSEYVIEETAEETYNGQPFTVITYTFSSETNPYQRGASAFGIYRNYAISVELSCMESFDGDAQAVLTSFLEHCHYAT